jgi:hypothetical protein
MRLQGGGMAVTMGRRAAGRSSATAAMGGRRVRVQPVPKQWRLE